MICYVNVSGLCGVCQDGGPGGKFFTLSSVADGEVTVRYIGDCFTHDVFDVFDHRGVMYHHGPFAPSE